MKKHILIIFFSLVIFIAGCQQTLNEDKKGPFIGGTEGLSIEFVNLVPPSQFNQDEDVKIRVLIKNNGENRVAAGNAQSRIFGINIENFGLTNKYIGTSGSLEGEGEFSAEEG